MTDAPPQPFFILEDAITAAENAARSARRLALENPERAERHREREQWYLERVKQWTEELEGTDERSASI